MSLGWETYPPAPFLWREGGVGRALRRLAGNQPEVETAAGARQSIGQPAGAHKVRLRGLGYGKGSANRLIGRLTHVLADYQPRWAMS